MGHIDHRNPFWASKRSRCRLETDPLWDVLCLRWADTGLLNSQHTAPLSERGWTPLWSCSSLNKEEGKGQDDSSYHPACCASFFPPDRRERCDCTWTFHIHKVRVGTLNETLLLVPPLLLLWGWMQQVFCELHLRGERGRGYTSVNCVIFATSSIICTTIPTKANRLGDENLRYTHNDNEPPKNPVVRLYVTS